MLKSKKSYRILSLSLCLVMLVGLLPVTAFAAGDVAINAINFPDSAFRTYVSSFDTDGNGSLSASEIAAVTEINVDNLGISSLKGIEFFPVLDKLSCQNNPISAFDISSNTIATCNTGGNSVTVNLYKLSPYLQLRSLKDVDPSKMSGFSMGTLVASGSYDVLELTGTESTVSYSYDVSSTRHPVFSIDINWLENSQKPTFGTPSVQRTGETTAKVTFTSSCSGSYYYATGFASEPVPAVALDGEGTAFSAGTVTIDLSGLSATRQEGVVVYVKDSNGVFSLLTSSFIPEFAGRDLVSAFKALDTSVTASQSFDYNLGSEGYYSWNGYSFYAKLVKIELSNPALIYTSFGFSENSSEHSTDTSFFIFKKDGENIVPVRGRVDNDSLSYNGEQYSAQYDAGTYYIAFAGYSKNTTGVCHGEIKISPISAIKELIPSLKELTTSTELPLSTDFELGSDGYMYKYEGNTRYAKLIRLDFSKPVILSGELTSNGDSNVDPVVYLFKKDGEDIDCIEKFDNDNIEDGDGELLIPQYLEAGTYYVVLTDYYSCVGDCHAELTVRPADPDKVIFGNLCFLSNPIPVADENDLWSYDAETKTLTLKDGFAIFSNDEDDAICLPDGATVVVEGEALIVTPPEYDDDVYCGIYADGALTIKGKSGKKTEHLTIYSSGESIKNRSRDTSDADLEIEDLSLLLFSEEEEGIFVYGNVTIKNSNIEIISENDCIEIQSDGHSLVVEDSILELCSEYSEAIDVNCGNVTLTNCDTHIVAYDDYGIYCDEWPESNENLGILTVTGGRLIIDAEEFAIEMPKIVLTDVVFDIAASNYEYQLVFTANPFSLPGTFRLYDKEGKLLYEGEWDEDLLNEYNELYVDGISVRRAVSVHEHDWSDEWQNDETHHWHECEADYCDVTENSEKDGYGEHDFEIRGNAKVCKDCGYSVAISELPPTSDGITALWIVTVVLSAAALLVAVYFKKKKREDK